MDTLICIGSLYEVNLSWRNANTLHDVHDYMIPWNWAQIVNLITQYYQVHTASMQKPYLRNFWAFMYKMFLLTIYMYM